MPQSSKYLQRNLVLDNGHSLVRFRQEVVFYGRGQSTMNFGPHRGKDVVGICRMHMSYVPCYDSIGQRSTQKQKTWKTVDALFCRPGNGWDFRTIISVNQLSPYGAVANMCEEYESFHDRSGRPHKVMGQSIVLSEIKTEVPLENDDPAYQNFVLQQYEERRGFHFTTR